MSKRVDPVTKIVQIYGGLSEFERGRVAQAFKMMDEMMAGVASPPERTERRGRPKGSTNRPKVNGLLPEVFEAEERP